MEECESVMEVECGEGEEGGVETQTEKEEVNWEEMGLSPEQTIVRYLLCPHLPYPPPHRRRLVLRSQTPRMQ